MQAQKYGGSSIAPRWKTEGTTKHTNRTKNEIPFVHFVFRGLNFFLGEDLGSINGLPNGGGCG